MAELNRQQWSLNCLAQHTYTECNGQRLQHCDPRVAERLAWTRWVYTKAHPYHLRDEPRSMETPVARANVDLPAFPTRMHGRAVPESSSKG